MTDFYVSPPPPPTNTGQGVAGKPTPEDRRRAVFESLEPYLKELASIQRMYPKRSIGARNVAQAGEQLYRAMAWTMEGVTSTSSKDPP